MKFRKAQSIGQVGFPGQNADQRRAWSPRLLSGQQETISSMVAELVIGGLWDLGTKAGRPDTRRMEPPHPHQKQILYHPGLQDRSSRHSHPGRRENREQGPCHARWQSQTKDQPAGTSYVPTVSRAQGAQQQAGSVGLTPVPPTCPGLKFSGLSWWAW